MERAIYLHTIVYNKDAIELDRTIEEFRPTGPYKEDIEIDLEEFGEEISGYEVNHHYHLHVLSFGSYIRIPTDTVLNCIKQIDEVEECYDTIGSDNNERTTSDS